MENLNRKQMPPSREEIALLAYQIWEQRGHPQGQDVEFWLEAERQVLAGRSSNALAVQRQTAQAVSKSSSPGQLQMGNQAAKADRETSQATPRATIPSAQPGKPTPRVAAPR